MASVPSARDVSESRRERETFRYDPSLISQAVHNNVNNLIPPSQLQASSDAALTAFAELGALRLNATRALISLFDSKYQYIVAESTPSLALTPNAKLDASSEEQFLLSGTAIPRTSGICDIALTADEVSLSGDATNNGELPVTVISDIASDPRSSQRPFSHHAPQNRFYAGVPIRTRRGINIGVFCVFGSEPRESLDDGSTRIMQDISKIIMDYLDAKRNRDDHRRSDRMVRGIGSFVEGKSTMSGWRLRPNADSFQDNPSLEGGLNRNQQRIQRESEEQALEDIARGVPSSTTRPPPVPLAKQQPALPDQPSSGQALEPSVSEISIEAIPPEASNEDIHEAQIKHVFAKAANVIREAIEVENVLFLDASIGSFGGLAASSVHARRSTGSGRSTSSMSSGDENGSHSGSGSSDGPEDTQCRVLGFSGSATSSIDGQLPSQNHASISERFLSKLLRRYPEGKIFNFDENGSIQSSDYSGDDSMVPPTPVKELSEAFVMSPPDQGKETQRKRRHTRHPFSRKNEGNMLISIFSGARSIAVVPLWDVSKQRWYAGGFACTKTATRILTIEGELSYLRAFGSVVMSEVDRINTKLMDKAKTDLLSSISHEIRSPLHGIILGAELLHDTPLDAFQGETLVSVENCGRTLLETIDHLLDWSKINNFIGHPSKRRSGSIGGRGLRGQGERTSIEAGMMSISSNVEIDVLAEEVVDSVCAGFSYQRISIAQLAHGHGTDTADVSMRRLGNMRAMEDMAPNVDKHGNFQLRLGDVTVTFEVKPADSSSWIFHTQPGALRRIIMNLLGNSLKYTSNGFVNVNIRQVDAKDSDKKSSSSHSSNTVEIIVTDSGRGISADYLQHQLFTPFTQEDNLSAGSGLGLSLVHQIVVNLGGSIHVWSKVDYGTRITVRLPLQGALPGPTTTLESVSLDEFQAQVAELRGLRVRLQGFLADYGVTRAEGLPDSILSEGVLLGNVCTEWLKMEVIEDSPEEVILPDLILSTDRQLDQLLYDRRHGGIPTPVVVICRNALLARRLATSPRFTSKRVVFEFISQPIGPRKLAKVLLLSFRRWTKLQAGVIRTPTAMSLASGGTEIVDPFLAGLAAVRGSGASTAELFPSVGASRRFSSGAQQNDARTFTTEEGPQMVPHISEPRKQHSTDEATILPERPNPSLASIPKLIEHPSPKRAKPPALKFLLVDDNPLNLKILASYVKKLGHVYDGAGDGERALEAFQQSAGDINCILMDISMPVMDGFEATRRIRAIEKARGFSRCHIFALTGLASAGAQEEAFASGIDLFLTKPVRLKELSKILETRGLS